MAPKKTSMGFFIDKTLEVDTNPSRGGSKAATSIVPPKETPKPEVVEVSPNTTSTTQTTPKPPSKGEVFILKDPKIKGLPFQKGDTPIRPDDTGDAIKYVQNFLQSLPNVQKEQQLIADTNFSSGGQVETLTSDKHYGKYDLITRRTLRDYQNANKTRIKKYGQLSDTELEKEINSGIITFATVSVILEDKGEKEIVQEGKRELDPPPIATEDVIKDPSTAIGVPEATFFVKTKNPNHRLALRKAPAYVKVSKEASEDEDQKGERVAMMPNETLLKVIQPYLGYNCLWHQVELVDPSPQWDSIKTLQKTQKLFCFAEFVQPLKNTPPLLSFNCTECTEIVEGATRKSPFPDWTTLTECDPFYDEETCKYYIVATTRYKSTSNVEISIQKKEALVDGVRTLLEFYDKQSGKETVDRLVNSIGVSMLGDEESYLDERPSSNLKFLVGIPGKYFKAIPRNSEFFDGVATLGGIMPKEWRTTVIKYNELKEGIDIVTKRFDEYAQEVDSFDGEVLDFDIREESKKLKAFLPIFDKFLKYNEVTLKEDFSNQFEIGFSGPCFKLIYVLEQKEKVSTPLRIGLECFKNTEPVSFARTVGYIFYLLEMVKDIKKEKRRWISFFNSYTCPLPRIIPSGGKPKSEKKLEENLNSKSIKTTTEKLKEDKTIKESKDKLISLRGIFDYVGDPLFSCESGKTVVDRVDNIQDLYKEILHKVSFNDLIVSVTSCIASGLTSKELAETGCDYVLNSLGYEELMKVIDFMNSNDVIKTQERIVFLAADPQFINADPTIKLRLAITQSADKEEICKAITKFDPNLISDFLKRFIPPKFGKFKVPTISLKDILPTEDTLRGIRKALEDAIKEAISKVLFAVVKKLFESMCRLCARKDLPLGDNNFGDDNLNDLFKKNGIDPKNIDLSDFDIPSDCEDLADFFDDLSNILTSSELCSLINNTSSNDVLNVIKNLLRNKYPCLSNYISDTYKIKRLFAYLGNFVDSSFCDEIESRFGPIPESLCEEKEDIKRNLLEGRMSQEQIDEQLKKEKERSKELIKQLQKLSEENSLNSLLPPIMRDACNKAGVNTASIRSLVPSNPPSIQKLNDQIVDVAFNPIEESFNNDVRGFVNSLMEASNPPIETDKSKRNELYDIERKKIEELKKTPEDQYTRLNNPEYKKNIVDVFPSLKSNLVNQNNFIAQNNIATSFDYKLTLDSSDALVLVEKNKQASNVTALKQQLLSYSKREVNLVYKDVNAAIKEIYEEESMTSWGGGGTVAPVRDEKMGQDTLIRNFIPKYSGDTKDVKDYYDFKINDVENNQEYKFLGGQELDVNIRNYIFQYGLKRGETIGQSVFANFIQNIWLNNFIQNEDVKKKIAKKGEFYNFLKNDVFADITTLMMNKICTQISKSPLFNVGNLEQIDFVPDVDSEDCNIKETKSLLDIESFKQQTKEKYEKEIDKCKEKLDGSLAQMDPIERSSMYSAIEVYIKVFVIENFLRGMFVFSEFKTEDLMGDETIVDFLVKRIGDELESQSGDFYKLILKCAKDNVVSRGVGTTDPFSPTLATLETGMDNKKIIDDSDPRWVSGEKALDFIVKENIKNVSEMFDAILGYERKSKEDLMKVFLDEWYPPINTPPNPHENNSSTAIKKYIEANGGKGNFICERYVRLRCDEEEEKKVYGPYVFMEEGTKFAYGIRLNYIFSDKVNFKGTIFDLELSDYGTNSVQTWHTKIDSDSTRAIAEKEMSYVFRFDTNTAINSKNWEYRYIFPVISIEEDGYRTKKLQGEELENLVNELKTKMINTVEYQTLFKFVFPLKRMISQATIYSILATSALIPNIDYKFGNTKNMIRNLINILMPGKNGETWWEKKLDGVKDNDKLRQEYMGNITTKGPAPQFASMALQTIPILIKGLAEQQDPCYGLMKRLWDTNPDLLIGGLGWGSVIQFMPCNFFPLIGIGPPLLPFGMAALSMPLLSGEKKHENKVSEKRKEKNKKRCGNKK